MHKISKFSKKKFKIQKISKFSIFFFNFHKRHGWNIWYNEHCMSKSVSHAISTLDLYHPSGRWPLGWYRVLGFIRHVIQILTCNIQYIMTSCYQIPSSMVDCGGEPWSDQTQDYKIGGSCFSTKHAALSIKSKNQNTLSGWSDMSFCRLVSVS